MKYKIFQEYIFYEDGAVVSPKGRQIKPFLTPKGYYLIRIKLDGEWRSTLVHTVLARAWLGEKPQGFEVDHINNIRTDNRIENLQYLSKRDNNKKSYDSGNRDVSGFNNANCKVNPTQIYELCELLDKGFSNRQCYNFTGISLPTISKVKQGERFLEIASLFHFGSRFRD